MEQYEKELAAAFAGRWQFRFLHKIGSTNDELKKAALAGAPAKTVLIADAQTAGHGRQGKGFFSPGGTGLYFSVLLRGVRDPFWITVAAGVAAARAIRTVTGASVRIKWVNDLFLGDRKAAGILAETVSGTDAVILGIGVNVFAPYAGFGALEETACPLLNTAPDDRTRAVLCAEILQEYFNTSSQKEILSDYRAKSYLTGKYVTVAGVTERLRGLVEGIGEYGELLLRTPDGILHTLISGEIKVEDQH